ncbi:MAG: GNAT family N-acetyltransferase [Lachnospiraceae bacterium]|nr:GNAT family N-acetyltransferase [Lachnospiraceae bacterium]
MADVSVTLRDIDEDNWMDVVLLTTSDEKEPRVLEEYVASNALSICQALYEETWITKAVYCGVKPVGFAMYGYSSDREEYELCRLMIDRNHQGKGIGSIALSLCLDELFSIDDCDRVYLQVHKDNERAKRIYARHGFRDTGEMTGDEQIYVIDEAARKDI